MLKFKEIKNSIIKNKYHGGTPHQEQPRYSYKITPKKALN